MRHLFFILFLGVCLLTISCKKESGAPFLLQGKWKLTASFISTGAPGTWVPAAQKKNYDFLQFYQDGKLDGTIYTGYKRYTVKDSTTLIFYNSDNSIENYSYKLKEGTLTLSPAGPIYCIEGCADRFVKVKD